MHLQGIIVAYLLMGKLEQVKVILWLVMVQIKELFLFHAMKFFKELQIIKIKVLNLKFKFLCKKFTMKEYKIYLYQFKVDLKEV